MDFFYYTKDLKQRLFNGQETGKANGLNPYKYLELLLTELPKSSYKENNTLKDNLLPWDPKVQKLCEIIP